MNRQLIFVLFVAAAGVRSANAQEWESLPKTAPAPKSNPQTKEKIELGKKLFFDPRLSITGTVSCNSCHNVMEGGDDGRATSMGIKGLVGPRNAPTVWNSAFQNSQFWDGRAASLEDQAKGPIVAAPEMGMPNHEYAIDRIKQIPGYQAEFQAVFGKTNPITINNAVKAIAAFERTLITPDSDYDRYVDGDKRALSSEALAGMKLFENAGCIECHSGPAFNGWTAKSSKPEFVKFPRYPDHSSMKKYHLDQDRGRFEVTQQQEDDRTFKIPTLRNITLTAPYMHNGKVADLPTAIRVMAKTQLDSDLDDHEVKQLVAFLSTLEGKFPTISIPRIPSASGASVIVPAN